MLEIVILVITLGIMYFIYVRRKFQLQISIREGLQIRSTEEDENEDGMQLIDDAEEEEEEEDTPEDAPDEGEEEDVADGEGADAEDE